MRVGLLLTWCVLVLVAAVEAQRAPSSSAAASRQAPKLPPLSMTCPVHPEIVESRPGSCPLCRRTLVPVRLDSAWMCPVHTAVVEPGAGTCRLCRRDLIRVTVSLTWSCRSDGREHLEPGLCDDRSPRIEKRTLRPHGNHNPKHGGQFFMAPDNWHHLEGVYPRDRTFRLYVYDDYARPLPPDQLRRLAARVVTEETFDAATRTTRELKAFPLRAARGGAYLEARVDAAAFPRELTAKVRLGDGAPEYRFDFTFSELTREPAPPPAAATSAAAVRPAPRAAAPAARPPEAAAASVPASENNSGEPPTGPDPSLVALPIPDTMEGMVAQLQTRTRQVGELIERGNFAAVYVPAFQAKDLAIALEPHTSHLSPPARDVAAPALERIVRTAWLLDAFGDVGNRQDLVEAYAAFSDAVSIVAAAFGGAAQ